jgi:glycosidase
MSNIPSINDYITFINNIICFIQDNGFILFSSSTIHVPIESIPVGKKKSNDRYELVQEIKKFQPLQKSKILTDIDYTASKKSRKMPFTLDKNNKDLLDDWGESTHESTQNEPTISPSDTQHKSRVFLKRRLSQSEQQQQQQQQHDSMDIDTIPISRPTRSLDTLITQDIQRTERNKMFDDIIKESISNKEKKSNQQLLSESEQDTRFNEMIKQYRKNFSNMKTQLDNLDLAILSEQDIQDLKNAENVPKPNQEIIQAKFDSIINTNYNGPEFENLRNILYTKQDDLLFITGKTVLDDPDADAAKRLLVLFYKAMKQNSNKYNELQKRRQLILERISKDRKTRNTIDKIYQTYLKSLEQIEKSSSILDDDTMSIDSSQESTSQPNPTSVFLQESASQQDSTSQHESTSESQHESASQQSTNTSTNVNIFIPRKVKSRKLGRSSKQDLQQERINKRKEYKNRLKLQQELEGISRPKHTDDDILQPPETRSDFTNKWKKFKS